VLFGAEKMETVFCNLGEAVGQAVVGQKVWGTPENHPLIGRVFPNDGIMNMVMRNEKGISWAEKIGASLNHVGDITGEKKNNLVKVVIMVIKLLGTVVTEMEKRVIAMKIAAGMFLGHEYPPVMKSKK
jgi:hypothetical protein